MTAQTQRAKQTQTLTFDLTEWVPGTVPGTGTWYQVPVVASTL